MEDEQRRMQVEEQKNPESGTAATFAVAETCRACVTRDEFKLSYRRLPGLSSFSLDLNEPHPVAVARSTHHVPLPVPAG